MDPLKEAFNKIKEEIQLLKEEIQLLRKGLLELHEKVNQTNEKEEVLDKPIGTNNQTVKQTVNPPLENLYSQNKGISTGNRGVPTDSQTDRQSNRHPIVSTGKPPKENLDHMGEVLDSLDNIKKELRIKFKRLTPQEMMVFSKIYELEDEKLPEITYKALAKRLTLSESSIREYVRNIMAKGVPLEKEKENNKKILLKISPHLKNLTTLNTLLRLREL